MTDNPFEQWYASGYTDLIPVVPPNANCLPTSHVKAGRGKSPGIRYASGLWGGFKGWNTHEASPEDLKAWGTMGASVGLRLGKAWMLDIDVYDAETADMAERVALEMLGPAPARIGQAPKRSLLYACAGDIKGQKMHFAGKHGEVNQIEIPAQSVVHGVHAKTGEPYTWPRGLKKFENLTVVTPQQLAAFFAHMRKLLPNASAVSGAAETTVNQSALRGHPDIVAEIMTRLPNTREMRWDYMVKVGYALHSALPDDPQLGFELWDSWCSRWDDEGYDPEFAQVRWNSFASAAGNYRVGAPWLYEEGNRLIGEHEHFDARALLWDGKPIDELRNADIGPGGLLGGEPENPFAEVFAHSKKDETEKSDTYEVLSIADLEARPPTEWLIARHVPKRSVGFVYSAPGAGKTFLVLDAALHIASGRDDWHGDALALPEAGGAVLYIASEGSYGFRNRVAAWKQRYGDSERLNRNFYLIEQTINFMNLEDVGRLLRTVKAVASRGVGLVLVVVDTVSRAMPGADENLQKDMTLFVRACDAVRDAIGGAVIGVHHAGKSGDMRGSTVLLGAGDFVFRLDRKKGARIGTLACEKQKDGPDGWDEPYCFDVVGVAGGDGETSVVVERADVGLGPAATLTPDLAGRVLAAMRDAWEAGEPWSKAPQSKERFAVRRMVADWGFDAGGAEEALRLWEASGLIVLETRSAKRRIVGFKVVGGPVSEGLNEGIFD